jgi:4-diphosphocytidyl-2-C-methyl-D-erythritol kinase
MTTHYFPAPAKLNLFLHVVGQRSDGYHLLQSVFLLLDLQDQLSITLREDGAIYLHSGMAGVDTTTNLVMRAARLLEQSAQERGLPIAGADLALEKHIPMGGGLGGGSSDAATTLIALNHLWQLGLTQSELMHMGLRLGADVPFFLLGQPAFVEGIGEKLTPLSPEDAWFVILHPGVTVPTPLIFGSPHLTRDTKSVKMLDFSSGLFSFGRNDLQAVAEKAFPEVAAALQWLGKFGEARMSGSGACVFARMSDQAAAEVVVQQLPVGSGWQAWQCQTLQRHPLAGLLEK